MLPERIFSDFENALLQNNYYDNKISFLVFIDYVLLTTSNHPQVLSGVFKWLTTPSIYSKDRLGKLASYLFNSWPKE